MRKCSSEEMKTYGNDVLGKRSNGLLSQWEFTVSQELFGKATICWMCKNKDKKNENNLYQKSNIQLVH